MDSIILILRNWRERERERNQAEIKRTRNTRWYSNDFKAYYFLAGSVNTLVKITTTKETITAKKGTNFNHSSEFNLENPSMVLGKGKFFR